MKGWMTSILLLSMPVFVYGQSFEQLAELPSRISESSGIEAINENLFITHNDGGDAPRLYFIDSTGAILREVYVANAKNNDWEDITVAPDGRVFIGDFGNNGHNRKNLQILALSDYRTWQRDTVEADTINFNFGDQQAYPPTSDSRVFDCEAVAFYKDSLYLFNKNWSSPFSGMTKMYVLPATVGNYTVYPRDSVNLGSIKEIAWVTGADITDSMLYLIGSAYLWKFSFTEQVKLNQVEQISLNHFSQKEAVSGFENKVYVTDESAAGFGNLYRYSPESTMFVSDLNREEKSYQVITTSSESFFEKKCADKLKLSIYSILGNQIGSIEVDSNERLALKKIFSNSIISPGIYWLCIQRDGAMLSYEKVFIGT